MRKIELLSPAKDAETAKQAILCGADAVYIGADEFGARSAAANTTEDIAELCGFAHLYGCKVYAALNTILSDAEIPRAAKLAWKLYNANVDALIVQDLGLLQYGLPPMPIHASTQCHTVSGEKAKFLEACGFDTIVVARELSLGEISEISKSLSPSTRLECFAHGALCVSYSGQCWLSYAIGGRSGNRGECAQPCRMKYELLDADLNQIAPPAHYLSLRDMNRSKSIGAMLDAGVDIFKIEGRLKDANYVKNITSFYRKKIDIELAKRRMQKSSYGDVETAFEAAPQKSFNRAFCEYHLHGTQDGCAAFETPKAKGEYIGETGNSLKNGFSFADADSVFANGDGLLFEFRGETFGAAVNKIDRDKVYVGHPADSIFIPAGAKIFRNKNVVFENSLEKKPLRKIPVEISLRQNGGEIIFTMKTLDDRNVEASVKISKFETAQNIETAKAKLAQNLAKLGDTPFITDKVRFAPDAVPFLKAAETNAVRRELCALLAANIVAAYNLELKKYVPRKPEFYNAFPAPLGAEANINNKYAEEFYKKFGAKVSSYAYESGAKPIYGERVMTTKHCILRELGMCKKNSPQKLKEPLVLRNESADLRIRLDCSRCGMDIFFVKG